MIAPYAANPPAGNVFIDFIFHFSIQLVRVYRATSVATSLSQLNL